MRRDGSLKRFVCAMTMTVLVCMLLSGCLAHTMDPSAWQDPQVSSITWPQAKPNPKIRLVRLIEGPFDLIEREKSAWGKALTAILGEKDEYLDFYNPHGLAADGAGVIYITDPPLGVIHRYDLASRSISYIAQAGERPLGTPFGVVLDREGNLYVTDSQFAGIHKFNGNGEHIASFEAQGKLQRPSGLAVNSRGDLYVADPVANSVVIFDSRGTIRGELSSSSAPTPFNRPMYVSVDRFDNVYVTDTLNFTVKVFDAGGTYRRSQGAIGDAPGFFARPKGISHDSDGNLYVIDSILANFQIFNPQGELLLYIGQEGGRPGEMMLPCGIFIDRHDRIYVADTFNHRIQVFQYLKEKAGL